MNPEALKLYFALRRPGREFERPTPAEAWAYAMSRHAAREWMTTCNKLVPIRTDL